MKNIAMAAERQIYFVMIIDFKMINTAVYGLKQFDSYIFLIYR